MGRGELGLSGAFPCVTRITVYAGTALAVIAALAIWFAPSGSASGPPPASPDPLAAGPCPDVFFVGAAGSGQLKQTTQEQRDLIKRFHGLGPEVYTMFVELQKRLARSNLQARRIAISYEASGVEEMLPTKGIVAGLASPATVGIALAAWQRRIAGYEASIDQGVENTLGVLRTLDSGRCGDAKVILGGYSQGAMVMHQAELRLADGDESAILDGIVGTLLLADGDRARSSAAASFGGSDSAAIGIRPTAHFTNGRDVPLPATTANICVPDDIVCDFAPTNLIRGGRLHTSYVDYNKEKVTRVDPSIEDGVAWVANNIIATTACRPRSNVSLIVDDSGSMEDTDPAAIRTQAIKLLLTKPSTQLKTIGAVEFGNDASTLFAPSVVGSSQAAMLGTLGLLQNDGSSTGEGSGTNYNAAFAKSRTDSPSADARIFLTDGDHNDGPYTDAHAFGPPTYVVGLSVTDYDYAELLQRIADETGGRYFSLSAGPGGVDGQLERLQPTINEIDALLSCKELLADRSGTLEREGDLSPRIGAKYEGRAALEVVTSWTDSVADIDVASIAAINRRGKVIADLQGKKKRKKLTVSSTEDATYETTTIQPIKGAKKLQIKVKGATLPYPTEYSVQIRSVPAGAGGGSIEVPPTPPAPTEPTTPTPPVPTSRVITVDNRVTNGLSMREDSTPVRLTTQPWVYCGSRGCNINGTERSSGGTYDAAVCQRTGERTTNGNDSSPADDNNPERFESTRYYGVRLSNGTFGYVSEVWIRAADRGGLGLPAC